MSNRDKAYEGGAILSDTINRDFTRTDTRQYVTSLPALSQHFDTGIGSFEGYVPSTIVSRDLHLPFKSERTDELVEDLKKTRLRDGWGNGQDSPMLAAFIIGEAQPAVEVYDGLHRQVANIVFQERHGIEWDRPQEVLAAIGNTAIHFVTVKPMLRRDMLDKRLTNTRNHPELRFARGGLWSAQLWYLDEISAKAPQLSAKQAFQLAERSKKDGFSMGAKLGMSAEVVEEVVEWAIMRADAWSVDPSTVYKWILRAEATTPEIIASVRNVGRGKDSRGVVSEDMITSIQRYIPGEQYHDTQRIAILFAAENLLSDIQFNNLLAEIMSTSKVKDATDTAQILEFLDSFDIEQLDSDEKRYANRRIRQRTDIFSKGGAAVASVSDAIDRVAESLDVRDERAHFVPDIDQRRAAKEAAEALEKQAEKALELADRARARAGIERDSKVRGFGNSGKAPKAGERYTESAPNGPPDSLRDIRDALPTIKIKGVNGEWSADDIDDALEIATVLAETLAYLSLKLANND